jgi:hypothetical protein
LAATSNGATPDAAPTASSSATASQTSTAGNVSGQTDLGQKTASRIIGDINIAKMALIYNMPDDASTHINAARQIISSMGSQTSPLSSSAPLVAGKLSYKTAQGNADYWIPVVNDRFEESDLQGTHLSSKNPDVDVVDAESVHYKLYLNAQNADHQLAKAQTAINEKQYDTAMNALQDVTKNSMNEVTVRQTPMAGAADNLILAQALVANHDYRGASYALKHANDQLGRAESENTKISNDTDIKNMRSQISSMQSSINNGQPSVQKVGQKIDNWIKEVKAKEI